jgi:hypothetical protein
MSKQPPQEALPTIDPAALSNVSGGAARGSSSGGDSDAAVMQALTGIMDSLQSIASSNQGGFGPTEMMMFMMMMGGGGGPSPAQVVAPANPYAGYTVDGVYYPFK